MTTYDVHPDIAEALDLGRDWPLARWEAWDHGASRTSQKRALQAIVCARLLLIWGGNKSGKTALNLVLGLCYALGGDHPAVQSFIRLNDLPLDLIPPGPGVTWFLAPTHDDSKRYHRGTVEALAGIDEADKGWLNRRAGQEATLEISVPGYSTPAKIVFKAHSQGVNGMKGDRIRYLGVDEEAPEPMFNEARKRLAEEAKGRLVFSMTNDPHSDIDWPKRRFVENRERGSANVKMWNEDNPHVPEGLMDDLTVGMTEAEIAAAKYGDFTTMKGLVWPDFDHGIHVVQDRPIPGSWPLYGGGDFGFNNPNVLLWGAVNDDGILEVYREYWRARVAVSVFAGVAKTITDDAGELFIKIFCDSSKLQDYAEMRESGLPAFPAYRDVETGVTAVSVRLSLHPPTVLIHQSCVRLINELGAYRRDARGNIIKRNDHGCDALRYLVKGVDDDDGGDEDWTEALDSGELEQESPWQI